jgi:succinyl-diaminopimelate desuccinylase
MGVKMSDEMSGGLTVNFGVFHMDETGAYGNIDCRAPACADEKNFLKPVDEAFISCGFEMDPDNEYEPCHHTPAESPFVKTLLDAYEECSGLKGECLAIGGGTYVHTVEGGVAFGCCMPGVNTNMHGADEFMPVADLILAAKIFTVAIMRLCA